MNILSSKMQSKYEVYICGFKGNNHFHIKWIKYATLYSLNTLFHGQNRINVYDEHTQKVNLKERFEKNVSIQLLVCRHFLFSFALEYQHTLKFYPSIQYKHGKYLYLVLIAPDSNWSQSTIFEVFIGIPTRCCCLIWNQIFCQKYIYGQTSFSDMIISTFIETKSAFNILISIFKMKLQNLKYSFA